jgi:DNA-binding NtrC family response regulator
VIERAVVATDGEMIGVKHLDDDPAGETAQVEQGSYQELKTEAERRIVLATLERHDWQVTRTAQALGLADHASLLKIMRRLGIRSSR